MGSVDINVYDIGTSCLPGRFRNAEHLYRAWREGAQFVEIGPVSPSAQYVHKTRRFFFFGKNRAIYDVSNKGVKYVIGKLQQCRRKRPVIANLTYDHGSIMVDDVVRDITGVFSLMYDFVEGFVIDTFRSDSGSPMLQGTDFLSEVIDSLLRTRLCYEVEKPIFVRVAEDIPDSVLVPMLDYLRFSGVDGIIAGYFTTSHATVRKICEMTQGRFPVIACGRTESLDDALAYFRDGATKLMTDCRLKKIIKALKE